MSGISTTIGKEVSKIVEIIGKGIEIDGDILKNSERGFETKIKIGERIGYGSNKAT